MIRQKLFMKYLASSSGTLKKQMVAHVGLMWRKWWWWWIDQMVICNQDLELLMMCGDSIGHATIGACL